MGQSNSRYQSSTSTAEDRSASNPDAPSSSSRPSRHSLLRRSFFGAQNSSSPSSSREGSLASSSNRRSWLNPRRWSQAPSSLAEAAADHPYHMDGPSNTPRNAKGKDKEGSGGAGVRDAQSQLSTDQRPADSNSFLSPQTVTSSCTSDNISEPGSAFVPVDEPSRLPSPVPPISRQDGDMRLHPTSIVAETPIANKQAPAPPPEPPTTDRIVETSENEPSTAAIGSGLTSDNTASSEPTGGNATAAAAAPAAATTRPFPPPGTLVVVQGVVHTTDVPRSNGPGTNMGSSGDATSTAPMDHSGTQPSRSPSQDRNAASARSRLSTLLRPRSTGPTSGTHGSDDAVQIIPVGQQTDSTDLHIDETIGTAESSTYASQEAAGADEPIGMGNESSRTTLVGAQHNEGREDVPGEVEQRNSDDANGSGPISSSSIDVLGTLLSVAAAATAASLLTGSSEPILQSNHSTNTLPNPAPNHSVTSAAPSPDFSAAGRAERMRSAWTSIRERLGIRSSGSSNSTNSNNTGASAAAQSAAEAREMMLGEMARAFSVGLGLGSFAGPTSSNNSLPANNNLPANNLSMNNNLPTNNNPPNRPAEAPLSNESRSAPSEGSFERFLMDLQADLRIALTTGDGGIGVRAMAAGSGWNDARSTPSNALEAPSGEGDTATFDNTESRPNEHSNDQDVPPLQDVDYAEGDSPHIEVGPEIATRVDTDGPQDGEGQRLTGPGRINWWRLYRFPAIGVPRSNSAAGAAAAAALSTSSVNAPSATLAPSGPSVPSSGAEVASTTPTITSTTGTEDSSDSSVTTATTPSTVVPVIIVGLQSVHVDWPQGEHAGLNANDHHLHHHNNDDGIVDDGIDDIFGPFSDQDGSPDRDADVLNGAQRSTATDVTDTEVNQRRGRWRSRAADAFRSLRTRRGGEQRNGTATGDVGAPHLAHQMPPMGPGSRMFLIYVIGGYYPPNHSIVLGNPADLESFEALSELADLLGQVKPPTATKEEIEKSGLQVFKASKIGEYEREGKIAGNCVERCLICLDDYDDENDIRMMACRHAFHKDCVDRWLETGKNNCPACRSRGVSTTETRSTFVS